MNLSENLLLFLAKYFYKRKGNKSANIQSTIKNMDDYDRLRYSNVDRVLNAAKRNNIDIENKSIVDLGCKDGAISVGYLKKAQKMSPG